MKRAANKRPSAELRSRVHGQRITASVQRVDDGFALAYVPRTAGVHELHVFLDGKETKQSPYTVLVAK